jgi:hypothetical protein
MPMRVLGYALAASVAACGFEGSAGPGGTGPDASRAVDAAPDDGTDGGATDLCIDAPEGIVAWWDGEELGVDIAGDFTMAENDFDGEPTITPGLVDDALTIDLEMNGDDVERVTISDAPRPETFTIEGWIRREDGDDDYQAIYGLECEIGLYVRDDRLTFYRRQSFCDPDNDDIVRGATALELDRWYHVAVTYDGGEVRVFIDGAADGSEETGLDIQLSSTARMGGVGALDGQHLFGQIDELTLYDRALDGPEIAAIAAAGAAGKCKTRASRED